MDMLILVQAAEQAKKTLEAMTHSPPLARFQAGPVSDSGQRGNA
jgi:hypothetical protein